VALLRRCSRGTESNAGFSIKFYLGARPGIGFAFGEKIAPVAAAMTINFPRPKAVRLRHQVASHHRYPIRAALEYRLMGKDWILRAGTGWTICCSSRRVFIECETNLPLDRRVELSIEWPVRLENNVCLKLHIIGCTVSLVGATTEVEILAYEFRTRALPPRRINQTNNATTAHWRQRHSAFDLNPDSP